MGFLPTENEDRQQDDFPQAAFGRVPEKIKKNSIPENFVN